MDNQIIHGSCFEVLPKLPAGCAKAVFIDPQYNIGFDYGGGKQDDSLPHEVYLGLADLVIHAVIPEKSCYSLSVGRTVFDIEV